MFGTNVDILQEASTGVVKFNEDDPAALDCVITFLYTLDYSDDVQHDDRWDKSEMDHNLDPAQYGRLMTNTEVYGIAERLDIPDLKELAKSKFEKSIGNNPCSFDDFSGIVRRVLQVTPSKDKGLREVCVDICVRSYDRMVGADMIWAEVLKDDPDFMQAVFSRAASQWSRDKAVYRANIKMLEEKAAGVERCADRLARAWRDQALCPNCLTTFVPSIDAVGLNELECDHVDTTYTLS